MKKKCRKKTKTEISWEKTIGQNRPMKKKKKERKGKKWLFSFFEIYPRGYSRKKKSTVSGVNCFFFIREQNHWGFGGEEKKIERIDLTKIKKSLENDAMFVKPTWMTQKGNNK